MGTWAFSLESRPGQPVIIGDTGTAGIELMVWPVGVPGLQVRSGHKPEHGAGGFEVLVYSLGTHMLAIEGQTFEFVPFAGATTWIGLTRVPDDPDEPGDPDGPGDPDDPDDPDGPPQGWPALFAKLDRIEGLLEDYLADPWCAPSRSVPSRGVSDE